MPARAPLPLVVLGPDGRPLEGAAVLIRDRGTVNAADVYTAATGETAADNPLTTDALGRVDGWVDRGAYDAVVSYEELELYTEPFEATPASDESIDQDWVGQEQIGTDQIADGAIETTKIASPAGLFSTVSNARMLSLGSDSLDSSSYTLLSPPDRLSVTLDAPGLIWIVYQARVVFASGDPGTYWVELRCEEDSLGSISGWTDGASRSVYTVPGEVLGSAGLIDGYAGAVALRRNAGEYEIDIRWRNTGPGTYTVYERSLHVWSHPFEDVS